MWREPGCQRLEELSGVSAGPERDHELDDLESYFSVQLERLEDIDPGVVPEDARAALMQAIEALLGAIERVREGHTDVRADIASAEDAMRRVHGGGRV